jgi:formylglycine-generating enzyme required for sulfatase activity
VKKQIFARGCAVLTAAAVVLLPSLIMIACEAFFPIDMIPEPPPALNTRTLQSASVAPGTQAGEHILTLDFGAGAIAGLDKADISLTTADNDCLLSKQGTLDAVGQPGTYSLKIGAVVLDTAVRTKTVTVSAGGKKADGTWLAGSATVDVSFKPVSQTRYKVFHLADAHTDGMNYPPVADTKLTLTLTAADQANLPPIQNANSILISMMTEGMAIDRGNVTGGLPVLGQGVYSQTWELELRQVTRGGSARVEVSIDGYIQDVRPVLAEFHNVSIAFNSAEEVWGQAYVGLNDGAKTTLNLSFSRDIPRFTLSDIAIQSLTPGGSLVLSNLQRTGIGTYTVDVSWGAPANWRHEANLTVAPADTVITPNTQKVFLSMRKVDSPGTGNQIALRRVPPGKFQRNTDSNAVSELSKAFWLGETEVTNGLWFEVMGYYPGHRLNAPTPVNTKGYYTSLSGDIPTTPRVPAIDDYPVHNVSWLEAIVFCNKLSILHNKIPVYRVNRSGWTSQADYDYNNSGTGTPTAVHCVDQNGDGWINGRDEWAAFRTGSGLIPDPAKESDWPYLYISDTYTVDAGSKTFDVVQTDLHKWKNNTKEGMVSIDTTATGYRLPFYHQWLWAAMGADMSLASLSPDGVNRVHYFKTFAGSNGNNNVSDYVWTAGNSGMAFPKAGTKKPNELGVYDLSGNMNEWLFDQIERLYSEFPGGSFLTMGDDDYYYGGGDDRGAPTFSWGGNYYESVSELSFGFWANNLRLIYGNIEDHIQDGFSNVPYQGFRVMRWVDTSIGE